MRKLPAALLLCACGGLEPAPPGPCLSVRRQPARVVCPSRPQLTGPDVSSYSGAVDWSRVRAAGHALALARVSDGLAVTDARFAANWAGMRAAGLVRGAYQHFRPGLSPLAQAEGFLAQVAAAGGFQPGDLPPVLDLEVTGGLAPAAMRAAVQTWLDAVEAATGRPPLIYTAAFMEPALGPGFGRYPLWVANHGVGCPLVPAGWRGWRLWQYTSAGACPGLVGPADLNAFEGTVEELQAWAGGEGPGQDAPDAGPEVDDADPGADDVQGRCSR
jgi:lysozyme